MELEDLKELIEILRETDITEIQVEKDGTKIKIKREKLLAPLDMTIHKTAISQEKGIPEPTDEGQRLVTITSPIVGTFYRAPSPDANPYIEIGNTIKPGDVVCIIEAMKLMNEIKSEIRGKVVDIAVENGQPVEFGQVLFVVEAP